ncbi:MAG: lipid asymmetry maintenance protein MlaB [Spirochaetaceae bacterium]
MADVHVDARRNPVPVAIRGDLTFSSVGEIRRDFERALSGGKDIEVSLDEVVNFDLPGVQLLLSLKASAAKQGVSVTFTGGKNEERFRKMLSFAGLPPL